MSVLWEKPSTAINPDICRSIEAPFADIKCYNPLQPSQKNQFEQKKKKTGLLTVTKHYFRLSVVYAYFMVTIELKLNNKVTCSSKAIQIKCTFSKQLNWICQCFSLASTHP